MKKVSLVDLFNDAPYFRSFEGLVGAKYHIKDPNDPNAPGLWFAKAPERILVAKHKPRLNTTTTISFGSDGIKGDVDDFKTLMGSGSKEATLAKYEFIPTDVEVGDAIYDYHITFNGFRDGWDQNDRSPGWASRMYKAERDNGALTQKVIPAADFHARYILDETNQCYREKPYQKKFVQENLMVEMPDGSVEQIPENCEVILKDGNFSFQKPSINSGFEERIIQGQPLEFYTREAVQMRAPRKPSEDDLKNLFNDMTLNMGGVGLGFMGVTVGRRGEKLRNPYGSFVGMYAIAKHAFNEAGMVLSPEQQGEFDRHVQDIAQRYAYFEAHPVVM